MRIRVPSKSARDGNKLRDVRGNLRGKEKEGKRKKERDARMPRRSPAIDIPQAVALNDYDTGTRYIVALLMRTVAREFS